MFPLEHKACVFVDATDQPPSKPQQNSPASAFNAHQLGARTRAAKGALAEGKRRGANHGST